MNGKLALRPCFLGARTEVTHADELLADVLRIGAELVSELVADGTKKLREDPEGHNTLNL